MMDIAYVQEDKHWITIKVPIESAPTVRALLSSIDGVPASAIEEGYLSGCMLLVSKVLQAITEGHVKMPDGYDSKEFHGYLELVSLAQRLTFMYLNGVENAEADAGKEAQPEGGAEEHSQPSMEGSSD